MDKFDYWRLCDELSVVHAALLIIGLDPEENIYIMGWEEHKRPEKFTAVLSALSNAIMGERLPATIRKSYELSGSALFEEMQDHLSELPDWGKTTVLVEDIKQWLLRRGFRTGFFFPQASDQPDFLDPHHVNYAPKLAAAIGAWQAVSGNQALTKGTTVKQALLKWLRKNADQFGLTKDDGNPNEQGIAEIAKISNWHSKGGAPKTPV